MPRFFSSEEVEDALTDAVIDACFELADTEADELFGDRENLPKDESDIVFSTTLTHEAKVQKLKAIRAAKRSRTRRAVSKPSKADRQWAGEMGVRL